MSFITMSTRDNANSVAGKIETDPSAPIGVLVDGAISLYSWLVIGCAEQVFMLDEMTELVGKTWVQKSCFKLPYKSGSTLRTAISMPVLNWHLAQHAEWIRKTDLHALLIPHLRYCPSCLEEGWHTGIFQHLAVRTCSKHGDALTTGCPHCGEPLDCSPESVVQNHSLCPACAEPVTDQVRHTGGDVSFIQKLRDALTSPPQGQVSVWTTADQAINLSDSPNAMNAIALHNSRHLDPIQGLRQFKTISFPVPNDELIGKPPTFRRFSFENTTRLLLLLKRILVAAKCITEQTDRIQFAVNRRWPPDVPLLLPTLAWWQTLLAVGFPLGCPCEEVEFTRGWSYPIERWLPDLLDAAKPVIEAHFLAVFAFNLVDLRAKFDFCGVKLETQQPNWRVNPAWWTDENRGSPRLLMRSRVDWSSVKNLIERYKWHCLEPAAPSQMG